MPDETTGSPSEGLPAYPGSAPPPPPAMPPPAPPAYPTPGGSGGSGGAGGYGAGSGYVAYPPPQGERAGQAYGIGAGGYAGWGTRLGGWLIDLVIFIVVQLIVGAVLRHSNAMTLHFTTTMRNGTIHHNRVDFLVYLITLVLDVIYCTILIGGRGQSVGMMAVGIRAVQGGTQDGPVGPGKAFWRALLEQVLRFTVIFWILDMLWPLWDAKNQTLHDKAVGTVVLRVRSTG